ncbi:OLC1v1038672C1 [Oldenlandia corymbosa var. corymbosa]|uniref:OLC1v1038672C1 n=1 Tax=Oldenlandia corymbosa var. corymbosa TaxID=529605 RepID=A0AAV1D0A7_OLDCO|nr:OLC1v1038672C1 [Oldenlandia corymbosa var. corymbosa]
MSKMPNPVYFLVFLLCFAMCSTAQQKQWCVAREGVADGDMQKWLDYACGQVDCAPINPGGSCFEPNTYKNHGSYSLDLFYRQKSDCNKDVGVIVSIDPSYPGCVFP